MGKGLLAVRLWLALISTIIMSLILGCGIPTTAACSLLAIVVVRIASYKAPKSVVFVKEIPKTGSGKIFKKALREQFSAPTEPVGS